MLKRFGGLDKFTKLWISHIRAAPPGSAIALRNLKTIAELVMIASEMRKPIDPEELSDDELATEIFDAAVNAVGKHPELALEAAQRLGAKVTWPEEDSARTRSADWFV